MASSSLFPEWPIQDKRPLTERYAPFDVPRPVVPPPFDVPYQRHSPTSRDAAERVEPVAGTQRARVFEFLRYCGSRGATDHEIQAALDMDPSTERPRRVELAQAGSVWADPGVTRPTPAGRAAQVWRAR